MMEIIKGCPFCGEAADIENTKVNGDRIYYISCTSCHIRSGAVKIGMNSRFDGKKDVDVTVSMAIRHLVHSWNARADEQRYPWTASQPEEASSVRVSIRRVQGHE